MKCGFCRTPQGRSVFRCGTCSAKRGYRIKRKIISASEYQRTRLYPALAGVMLGGIGAQFVPAASLAFALVACLASITLVRSLTTLMHGPRWFRRV